MSCKRCSSENQDSFKAESAIHSPDLTAPHIFLFSELLVCLDCGFTEFSLSNAEMEQLGKSKSTEVKSG